MPPVVVIQSSPPYAFRSLTLNAGASAIAVLEPEDAMTVATIASAASAVTAAARTDRRSMSPSFFVSVGGARDPASVTPQPSAPNRLRPTSGVVFCDDGVARWNLYVQKCA